MSNTNYINKFHSIYLPEGSSIRFSEEKTFDKGTMYERHSLLIHHINFSYPDCSPFRIFEIILSSNSGYQGGTFRSYQDGNADIKIEVLSIPSKNGTEYYECVIPDFASLGKFNLTSWHACKYL